MALPAGTITGTTEIDELVKIAFDQYVRMALRSIPVMRSAADVKPVQQAMPGSSVVFSIYSDLAIATSTLGEESDVSSVALGDPSQVTVTLFEYGNVVTRSNALAKLSFSSVDEAIANIIAYNAADSIDSIVAGVLTGGTNVIYGGATATSTDTITSAAVLALADIREAVTKLRSNKAVPRMGDLYTAFLHPRQSHDLQAETGTGGFQDLSKFVESGRGQFATGIVGVIAGATVIETPRVPFAANTQPVNVYKAVVLGKEALAEATVTDVQTVIGPEIDALRRFRTIGWHYFGGWSRLREASLFRIETSSSLG
jgi:N4-gp56 family major capsid protein